MRKEIERKIAENVNPLKMHLVGLNIRDDEIQNVLEAITPTKDTLTVIDLDDNQISDEGAIILSQALRDFKQIKEISLQHNRIDRKGALALFSLKKYFPDLDILFHGNKIIDASEMDEIENEACSKFSQI